MCACDEGAICSRCRPVDYFDASHDRDDPYNDQPEDVRPAEYEVT